MRTTIDIDQVVLRDLQRLKKQEAKSLGQLVSELLAPALAARLASTTETPAFVWHSAPMMARARRVDGDASLGGPECSTLEWYYRRLETRAPEDP